MSRRISTYLRQHHIGLLALFLVMSGGTAYALDGENTVFSDDIVNREVRSPDIASQAVATGHLRTDAVNGDKVANGSLGGEDVRDNSLSSADVDGSLTGADVLDNTLHGSDVQEDTLAGVGTSVRPVNALSCDPNTTAFVICSSDAITFQSHGAGTPEALLIATISWRSNTGGGAGICSLFKDGSETSIRRRIGETQGTTDSSHNNETTLIAEVSGTAGTSDTFSVRCNETEANMVYEVSLATIGDVSNI